MLSSILEYLLIQVLLHYSLTCLMNRIVLSISFIDVKALLSAW